MKTSYLVKKETGRVLGAIIGQTPDGFLVLRLPDGGVCYYNPSADGCENYRVETVENDEMQAV